MRILKAAGRPTKRRWGASICITTADRTRRWNLERPGWCMITTRTAHGSGAPQAIVNNSANQTSPRPPLQGSPSTFDRRGARAKEHAARPPARFSSLSSHELHNQTQQPCLWHGHTKVPNSFQDLTDQGTFRFFRQNGGGERLPQIPPIFTALGTESKI